MAAALLPLLSLLLLLFVLAAGLADAAQDAGRGQQQERRRQQGQETDAHQRAHHLQQHINTSSMHFLPLIELDEIIGSETQKKGKKNTTLRKLESLMVTRCELLRASGQQSDSK